MAWKHDHGECTKRTPTPTKHYDRADRRYTVHEFKSQRYVEAVRGSEQQAERRCIDLKRQHNGKADFFYRAA
jgi:hypothetical protein